MNTQNTAPDFGEPWHPQDLPHPISKDKGVYWLNPSQFNRAVACVNACQSMADPAAEIEMLKLAQSRALDAADVLQNVEEERDELRRDVSALLNALPNGAHDVTEGVVSIRAMRAAIVEAHEAFKVSLIRAYTAGYQHGHEASALAKLQPFLP